MAIKNLFNPKNGSFLLFLKISHSIISMSLLHTSIFKYFHDIQPILQYNTYLKCSLIKSQIFVQIIFILDIFKSAISTTF